METFYTVDRRGLCKPGGKLQILPIPSISINGTKTLYKQGITPHGNDYFLNYCDHAPSNILEIVWELIRLKDYPHTPSRFQSYFGLRTVEDAKIFRGYRDPYPIYKIKCNKSFEADMNLLIISTSPILMIDCAHKYWSQIKSSNPFIEYLLTPDIDVICQVA